MSLDLVTSLELVT